MGLFTGNQESIINSICILNDTIDQGVVKEKVLVKGRRYFLDVSITNWLGEEVAVKAKIPFYPFYNIYLYSFEGVFMYLAGTVLEPYMDNLLQWPYNEKQMIRAGLGRIN